MVGQKMQKNSQETTTATTTSTLGTYCTDIVIVRDSNSNSLRQEYIKWMNYPLIFGHFYSLIKLALLG